MDDEVTSAGCARSSHASRDRLGGVRLNKSGAKLRKNGWAEPGDAGCSLACRPWPTPPGCRTRVS